MLNILETILYWIKGILPDCITDNLSGMFDQINTEVGAVAGTGDRPRRTGTPGSFP